MIDWLNIYNLIENKNYNKNLIKQDFESTEFLKLLSHNRLLYLFSRKVLSENIFKLEDQLSVLKRIVENGDVYIEKFRDTINFIKKVFTSADIEYLIVKTYKTIDYITFDVDVLVSYKDFEKAQEVLTLAGCHINTHPRKQGVHQRNCKKEGLLNIDLHRDFFWQGIRHIDLDLVWSEKHTRKINGIECLCPSLEVDYLLHSKQLAYERYYITLLDYIALHNIYNFETFKKDLIEVQIKKYKWEHTYYSLLRTIENLSAGINTPNGINLNFPYIFQYSWFLKQQYEMIMNNRFIPFYDFAYYNFTFLRYYLGGKKRLPYYDHWFDFNMLDK